MTFHPASDSATAGIKCAKSLCTTTDEAVSATLARSSSPYLDMLLATELFWRVLDPSTRSRTSFRLCLEGGPERGLKRSDGLQSGKRVDRRVGVEQVDVVEGGVDAGRGHDETLRRRSEGLLDQVKWGVRSFVIARLAHSPRRASPLFGASSLASWRDVQPGKELRGSKRWIDGMARPVLIQSASILAQIEAVQSDPSRWYSDNRLRNQILLSAVDGLSMTEV
jgi:hypothetical protein